VTVVTIGPRLAGRFPRIHRVVVDEIDEIAVIDEIAIVAMVTNPRVCPSVRPSVRPSVSCRGRPKVWSTKRWAL
jgi:hypothetical protein